MSTYDDLLDALGQEKADRLCRERGSHSIYIPARRNTGSLLDLLSETDVARLRDRFGPGVLEVPTGAGAVAERRHAEMVEMIERGVPSMEIARTTGLHLRTIRRARSSLKPQ